jgi:septal ring factor EnvC (AmiA/AmiB activator)
MPISLIRLCAVLALLSSAAVALGDPDALPAAQRRMTEVMKELSRTQADVKRQEKRLLEAEAKLTRSQQTVADDKARLEQARKNLDEARGSAQAAQHNYDQANEEIQRLYRERQRPSDSKP